MFTFISVKLDSFIIKFSDQNILWHGLIGVTYVLITVIKKKIADMTPVAKNHIAIVSDLGPHF